jgi:hypothetical protein
MTQQDQVILDVYNAFLFPVHFNHGSDFSTILNSQTNTFIYNNFDYYAESQDLFSSRDMVPVDNLLRAKPQSCLLAIFKDDSANIKS